MPLFNYLRNSFLIGKPISGNLTYADKEKIIVRRIKTRDMHQFTSMPYLWNQRIKKAFFRYGHPFAYMDIVGENVAIAKAELSKMNDALYSDTFCSSAIPNEIKIPIQNITFTPSKDSGYTRLICNPYTFTGEISEYPLRLFFETIPTDCIVSTHGSLFYGQDGTVKKAELYFWESYGGMFFYYDTVNGKLALSKVEVPAINGQKEIVYKGPHIVEWEARRAKEEIAYTWVQKNLLNICPQTLSGFRRMKTQNTKNYQKIVAAAKERGVDL